MALPKVLAIFGPTGSGKTKIAGELSDRYEIISVDSRQVYRGLSIASAAPAAAEKEKHNYHLVEFLEPDKNYDAGTFAEDAGRLVNEIHGRGKIPALVGGSGFYFAALFIGLAEIKEDPAAQKKADGVIAQDIERPGSAWAELNELDSSRAGKLHPNDRYRIGRALVQLYSGYKPAQLAGRKKPVIPPETVDLLAVEIRPERDILYNRIDSRMDKMLEAGIVREYEKLKAAGFTLGDPGMNSLGYNFIEDYLTGRMDYEQMVFKLKQSHRKYAKKQLTYFKSQLQIQKKVGVNFDLINKWIQNWEEK